MRNIKIKNLYCPVCTSKLHKVKSTSDNELYSVCTNSSCRAMIKDNLIDEMDISIYSRLQQFFSCEDNAPVAYMLLRESLSSPLLTKATNNPVDLDKCLYNIVNAMSKDDAINKFKLRFQHLNITDDMVVPVRIMEDN